MDGHLNSTDRDRTLRARVARIGLLAGVTASAAWSAAVIGSVWWVLDRTVF